MTQTIKYVIKYKLDGQRRWDFALMPDASQEQALEAFQRQQLIDRKAYKLLITAERADACAKYDKAKHDEKIAKRRANEEYMDKVGIAFAEYNKDRVSAGEQPVYYEKSREILAEERKAGYSEDGWPADPQP